MLSCFATCLLLRRPSPALVGGRLYSFLLPVMRSHATPTSIAVPRTRDSSWVDDPRSFPSSGEFYSSVPPPPASSHNPVKLAARALFSWFGSKLAQSESDVLVSEELRSPHLTPGRGRQENLGSLTGNDKRQIHLDRNRPCRTEPGCVRFTMEEIQKATKNFSPSLEIGQGGSGTVYKAQLDDGTVVAVKRTIKNMFKKHLTAELRNEIQTLANIEHLNLVRLHGFLESDMETVVVVEYVSNGTLRDHLDCQRGKPLNIATRLDIAIDVAHAVTFLHMYSDHPIIHRDIKSTNILLTDNLRAKVADFGFARLAETEFGVTHVTTQVKGTLGYIDPEYHRTYQLTEKSDVYSFGVLLVELVTGRRPIETKRELSERLTLKWAMPRYAEGHTAQILDSTIAIDPASMLAVEQILELALKCLPLTKKSRPSMQKCAEILWAIRKTFRHSSS